MAFLATVASSDAKHLANASTTAELARLSRVSRACFLQDRAPSRAVAHTGLGAGHGAPLAKDPPFFASQRAPGRLHAVPLSPPLSTHTLP